MPHVANVVDVADVADVVEVAVAVINDIIVCSCRKWFGQRISSDNV